MAAPATEFFGAIGGGARYISRGARYISRGAKVKNVHEACRKIKLKMRLNMRFLSLNWLVLCEIEENRAKCAQICCFC